jgi:hypothetical protein
MTCQHKNKPWTVDIIPDRGVVIKKWTNVYYDLKWVQQHVECLSCVNPGYVINSGVEDDLAFIEYRYIEGMTLGDWSRLTYSSSLIKVEEMWRRVGIFWVDEIERTYPFAHWDWTSGNTIITPDDALVMIDWDQLKISDIKDTRDRFSYRLERERREIVKIMPSYNNRYTEFKSSVLDYFDKKFL